MQLTLYATLLSTMQEAIVGNGIFRHRFFSPWDILPQQRFNVKPFCEKVFLLDNFFFELANFQPPWLSIKIN